MLENELGISISDEEYEAVSFDIYREYDWRYMFSLLYSPISICRFCGTIINKKWTRNGRESG